MKEVLKCLVLFLGLVGACEWEQVDDRNLELNSSSIEAGAHHLAWRFDISDPELCRAECCADPRCQLALLGFPMDGSPQCVLVSCLKDGKDVCVLQPSSQFQVVGKRKPLRVEPLLGEAEDTAIAVQPRNNLTNNALCRQPMKVGSCRAAFPKFYYDVANQTCRSFTYGGCEANDNNFNTQEECQTTCSGVTGSVLPDVSALPNQQKSARMVLPFNYPAASAAVQNDDVADGKGDMMSSEEYSESCEAQPVAGPCRAAFRHWYYDRKAGVCKAFVYGGCRGNKNNYMSQQSCLDSCQVTVLTSKRFLPSYGQRSECESAPDPGPCRAAFPAYYYDGDTDSCRPFVYGGCHGNQNRYKSTEDCMARCSTDGAFEGLNRGRSRWTAAFFVLLALAAICVLLVTALIVATMLRRLPFSRSSSIISDKEELLPDEQPSQEFLDFPETPKGNTA
ncbi:kunitz-type protease inhibitor 2 isoform X3 [Nerophis lumbriciformis]|uniref:kunitz-type protease inhibitor 2 isoform X3 n=1 Tax=Nerophis lumbriciformis TaxID=546530 RepID=UPI002ADFF81E|nr:kunitz-type protease inhibitor 2 isoform X3 [Nerophis lumbriciformis]